MPESYPKSVRLLLDALISHTLCYYLNNGEMTGDPEWVPVYLKTVETMHESVEVVPQPDTPFALWYEANTPLVHNWFPGILDRQALRPPIEISDLSRIHTIDQMFELCTDGMRKEKHRSINADYLSEEVSDRFGIFDSNPSIIIPDWITVLAKAWLLKQDWFIPDADETFWTE